MSDSSSSLPTTVLSATSPPPTPIFVTGIAGFIGYSVAYRLLRDGVSVVGIDNFNDYYDPQLKFDRIASLNALVSSASTSSIFCETIKCDLTDLPLLQSLFEKYKFQYVIHLAAQAGVRYSLTNPHAYVQSNLVGFVNILECCRHAKVQHLVYASSSSVYGGNTKTPYCESDAVDHPVSMYAATKKSNEVLAHSYSHLFSLPCTGLRFFTVYGPWGRPDMAVWSFTEKIMAGKAIELFDHGKPSRDFTFIDDIVEGVLRVMKNPPTAAAHNDIDEDDDDDDESENDNRECDATEKKKKKKKEEDISHDPSISWAPFRVLNIGGSHPHTVLEFVTCLEDALGKKADKKLVDAQAGDVSRTEADTRKLQLVTDGFVPQVSLKEGLKRWVEWYVERYPLSRCGKNV